MTLSSGLRSLVYIKQRCEMSEDMDKCDDGHRRLTKCEKKNRKKLRKYKLLLARQLDVDVVEKPSQVVMICNMGLTTETEEIDIIELFQSFILERVVMPRGKSFSFVKFKNVDDAIVACDRVVQSERSPRLAYVDRLPELQECESATTLPEGLLLLKDVISEEEELSLLKRVSWEEEGSCEATLKNRRVKHFGYEFRYDTNGVDHRRPLDRPIPTFCEDILKRFLQNGHMSCLPDQLTVNEYQPGQGIPSHVDTHSAFGEEILSLSLGSGIVMDFSHSDGRQVNVFLPPRSLLVMTGESRYLWSHGIRPRKTDVCNDDGELRLVYRKCRTSFTFRTLRRGACCDCQFQERCDSRKKTESQTRSEGQRSSDEAQLLEDVHVHEVYDNIANHFSDTRYKPWPRVENFVAGLPTGSLLLDVGCGNGKYLDINEAIFKVGCDRSSGLASICSQKSYQIFCCDALKLPVRSNVFDACLCIAVIHHFATQARRVVAIQELVRVLRPGGKCLIYVWSMEQKENEQDTNYIKPEKETNKLERPADDGQSVLPIHTNGTHFQHADLLVPWHLKSKESELDTTYHRYYHVFCKGELEKCCEEVGCAGIVCSYYDKGNWCIILEKKCKN